MFVPVFVNSNVSPDFPNAWMPNKSNYYIYVIHMASSYSADGSSHKKVQSLVEMAVKHTRFMFGTWSF